MTTRSTRKPVLVVGAGPVGIVLALELARNRVPSVVVERTSEPSSIPRTHHINSRSMELLRRLGLADAVREHGVDPDHSTDYCWIKNLTDPPVLVWHYPSVNRMRRRYAGINDGTAPVEPYQRISGAKLERLGRAAMTENRLIDLRQDVEVIDIEPGNDGLTVKIVDHASDHHYMIEASFVAVCDGASSRLRTDLGIHMDDSGPARRFRSVHFVSGDEALRRFGTAFTTIGSDEVTLVSHGADDEWTGSMPVSAGCPQADPIAELQARLGNAFAVDRVIEVTEWEASLSVAVTYNKGRVYLVGDAAHEFHPTGGYGINTGISDAVDLGWKLAGAVHGWGGPRLLASYEQERRPVALFNRELNDELVELGRRYTRMLLAGVSTEQLAGVLEQQVHRIDDLGVQLGYRYSGSPVVWHETDEAKEAPAWQWRGITASTWPGVRVPAVRMRDGTQLYDRLGPGFTLVDISGRGAGEGMVRAAVQRRIPMKHLRVSDPAVLACWERDLVLVRPDHHVAWRGEAPPEDWETILARVTGNGEEGPS